MESSNAAGPAGWDRYWQGAGGAGAFSIGGVHHPAVAEFWNDVLSSHAPDGKPIVDIATGSGAVVERILEVLDPPLESVTCVDVSPAAIEHIAGRWPGVTAIVADARDLPLDDGAYALATSQFGVEYAGPAAILEAARLVGEGGALALLVHVAGGRIEQECRAGLDAVRRLSEAGFVKRARQFFDTGFKAVRGGPREDYEAAGRRLGPAIDAAEQIIEQLGEGVAAGTVMQLYRDVARIHERIQHYDPDDVLAWLDRMAVELDAYAERMASMCSAAVDDEAFSEITDELSKRGFTLERRGHLAPADQPLPLARTLVAVR